MEADISILRKTGHFYFALTHAKGALSDSQRGRLPTPQKRDARGPSTEINESNIWVVWENPTDKDETRR